MSDKVRVSCAHCSTGLKIPVAALEKEIRCPRCKSRFVPRQSDVLAPSPPSPKAEPTPSSVPHFPTPEIKEQILNDKSAWQRARKAYSLLRISLILIVVAVPVTWLYMLVLTTGIVEVRDHDIWRVIIYRFAAFEAIQILLGLIGMVSLLWHLWSYEKTSSAIGRSLFYLLLAVSPLYLVHLPHLSIWDLVYTLIFIILYRIGFQERRQASLDLFFKGKLHPGFRYSCEIGGILVSQFLLGMLSNERFARETLDLEEAANLYVVLYGPFFAFISFLVFLGHFTHVGRLFGDDELPAQVDLTRSSILVLVLVLVPGSCVLFWIGDALEFKPMFLIVGVLLFFGVLPYAVIVLVMRPRRLMRIARELIRDSFPAKSPTPEDANFKRNKGGSK